MRIISCETYFSDAERKKDLEQKYLGNTKGESSRYLRDKMNHFLVQTEN